MWRAPVLLLAFAVVALLEWFLYPGHTFLSDGTQVFVPALARLQAPGLLSRDLVATHANVTDTAYDEITLSVGRVANCTLERALADQQFLFRLAALLGVYWLARSAGARRVWALALSAGINLGTYLPGPDVFTAGSDPTPFAFSCGAVLLAAGAFAAGRSLLAGFAGGLALLYDWRIAVPFWLAVAIGYGAFRWGRSILRASLPLLAVFALLLANLAQLQPGVIESQSLWARVPDAIAAVQRFRTPDVWVSIWPAKSLFWAVFVVALWAWATVRIWTSLPASARVVFCGVPALGVAGTALSAILLDAARWYVIAQIAPARLLIFTATFAGLAATLACLRQWRKGHRVEATAFLLALFLLPLPRPQRKTVLPVADVAQWAEDNTWGASMFAFPDAGEAGDPGRFRAEARRAVWVDWETGRQADIFDSFADEWYRRWQDTMAESYSQEKLRGLLPLPIDYYVLRRANALPHVRPAFCGRELIVYDAHDLRTAHAW